MQFRVFIYSNIYFIYIFATIPKPLNLHSFRQLGNCFKYFAFHREGLYPFGALRIRHVRVRKFSL